VKAIRYLALIGLLLGAVAVWQFGEHDANDLNPFDEPDTPAEAAALQDLLKLHRHAETDRNVAKGIGIALDAPTEAVAEQREVYVEDRIMVHARTDARAERVARRYQSKIIRPAGPSGYAVFAVPDGVSRDTFVGWLLDDSDVLDADRIGRIYGADAIGGTGALSSSNDIMQYQWHLDASGRPAADAVDDSALAGVKVAVLDTGVAYEDHDGGVGLPSFAQVPVVHPWDFVNGDATPYDDHQHGSHIASVIASYTEAGDSGPVGIAPGVTLMPVKVLDQDNAGYETDLLDALAWTVTNDAQIVNMSLSFGEGYVLSAALDQALADAADAGAVLVAAAGNNGASFVTYPAAHRDVIAVGAGRLHSNDKMKVPDYSNVHPRVDLLGAGGDIALDKNNDGVVDGVLGETIALQDATAAQYVLYAGTSQATGVISAAAAWLLADGVHPDAVRHVLQRSAVKTAGGDGFESGTGAGCVDIDAALAAVTDADRAGGPPDDLYVAILPFIEWTDDDSIRPMAEITVVDGDGAAVDDAEVVGSVLGSTATFASCTTDSAGSCLLAGHKLDGYDEATDPGNLAWAIEVPTVVIGDAVHHPRVAFFASDALEILLAAIEAEPELAGGLLGFHWPGESNEYGDLLESYFLVDLGVGLGGTPLGIIVPRATFGSADATIDVDLDGTGLGGTPLGIVPIPRFDFDGTGLGGTPLGGRIIIFGGGLGGTPLGLRPPGILGGGGLGGTPLGFHDSPYLNLDGHSVRLGTTAVCGTGLGGTALGTILDRGGWTAGGYGGASALVGSGDVPITASSIESMVGSGTLDAPVFEGIEVCEGEGCD
jgi:subtilisin family serine protease